MVPWGWFFQCYLGVIYDEILVLKLIIVFAEVKVILMGILEHVQITVLSFLRRPLKFRCAGGPRTSVCRSLTFGRSPGA